MRIIRGIEKEVGWRGRSCLTIGTFDGVHLGHQAVIKKVVEKASREGLTSVVMTFDPHPRISLGKGSSPPLLTCSRHKLSLLEGLGVEVCLLVELEGELAAMAPSDFVVEILHGKLRVGGMVIGPRLRFGKGRRGTPGLLKELGEKLGFGVEVVKEVSVDGVPVSSTMVRQSVLRGDLCGAESLLGRRYSVLGRVVRGRTIGRKLGYRTANIKPFDEVVPPAGVYAVEVVVNRERHRGALNLGRRPTFPREEVSSLALEAHLLDFDRPIYRREVEVVFHRRLRDEQRFATSEELAGQIALDIEVVRRYFSEGVGRDCPRGAVPAEREALRGEGIC